MGAVRRARDGEGIALEVGVVREDVDLARSLLGGREGVVDRDRGVVAGEHRDGDRPGVRLAAAVGDRVVEGVRPVVVRARRVGANAARGTGDGPVSRRRRSRGDAQRVPVHVRVAGQHVRRASVVLDGGDRVRDVVHRGHRDLDVGGVRPTLAVGDRVLERVVALEVRFRGVGADASDRARDRAVVGRRLERLEGERIAVVVGVVGEDVDAVRRVLGERERVFGRARLLVRRHDLDGDVPDVGCHPGRRTPCT